MRSLFKEYIPESHKVLPFNNYGAQEDAALMRTLSIDPSKFSEDNIIYEEEKVTIEDLLTQPAPKQE